MEDTWQEFIENIHEDNYTEYGDFKREMDAQLRHLVEVSGPLTEPQVHEIVQIRQDYLWTDHPDEEIDNIKNDIIERIKKVSLH